MEDKHYNIGGKVFEQRTLVLGQWKELGTILREIAIPIDITPVSLVRSLGNNLFAVMAVILTEEGKSPQGKDLASLAVEIEWGISPSTAIEVIAHFFELNPIPSLLHNLEDLAEKIREKLMEIGLTNSASSSAAETSPVETGSSGTLQPEKPEDGQNAP